MSRALLVVLALAPASAAAQGLVTSTTSAQPLDHETVIARLDARLDEVSSRLERVADQVGVLRDTALGAGVEATRAVLVHKNQLGRAFALERIRYVLDGGVLLEKVDEGGNLSGLEDLVLFDGRIEPGEHVLEVEGVCRGGGFGVFSYVEAYRFRLTSRYILNVREGRSTRLEIVLYQRPDLTLEAAKRLDLRYDVQTVGGADDR